MIQHYSWHEVTQIALTLCSLPLKSLSPQLLVNHEVNMTKQNHKKNTKLNWGTFLQVTDQYSSKWSRLSKTRKIWKTIIVYISLKRQKNEMWSALLPGMQARKKDIGGNKHILNKTQYQLIVMYQCWLVSCNKSAIKSCYRGDWVRTIWKFFVFSTFL